MRKTKFEFAPAVKTCQFSISESAFDLFKLYVTNIKIAMVNIRPINLPARGRAALFIFGSLNIETLQVIT